MSINSLNAKGKESYESIVSEMYTYFNKHILNNKRKKNALNDYKNLDYQQINGLLYKKLTIRSYDLLYNLGNITRMQKDNGEENEQVSNTSILNEMKIAENIKRCVKTIKTLDDIISKAPKIKMTSNITLYRGLNADILDSLVCDVDVSGNNTYYYTTPSYMSTSFSPSVSLNFTNPKKCGIFLTIITTADSLKELQGVFVKWNFHSDEAFENADIDSEYEFILPRLSKFKVEKVDYIPYPTKNVVRKYRDIPCKKLIEPLKIKHYTLSVVSQPTLKDLSQTYKSLYKDVKITIEPQELTDLSLEVYLKEVASKKKTENNNKTNAK